MSGAIALTFGKVAVRERTKQAQILKVEFYWLMSKRVDKIRL
jgi:hypothetical protein